MTTTTGPGRYVLEALSEDTGFAPVFYPGVTSIAEAVPFVIGRSQEVRALLDGMTAQDAGPSAVIQPHVLVGGGGVRA